MAEPERMYHPEGEPIGAVVRELLSDLGDLIRSEIQLARVEMTAALGDIVRGSVWLVVGLAVVYLGVAFLLFAAISALAATMSLGLAALIVALIVLVLGGIAIWAGYQRVKRIGENISLTTTRESLQEDAEWLRNRMR